MLPTSTPAVQFPFPRPSRQMSQLVQYQDEYEQKDASLQLEWTAMMGEGSGNNSSLYKKVKVLVISWDEKSDDLKTKAEVEAFSRVLTDVFKYKVVQAVLQHSERFAQLQIVYHVSNFLYDEDGLDTLLIVYYAGHGTPGKLPGTLRLSGKRGFSDSIEECNEIIWNSVETALQATRADILEIFDCGSCYAGDLGGSQQTYGRRSFEFLGATSSASVTRSPGEESFTSALIWALKDLVTAKGRFTVSELSRRIRDAPNFPPDQVPVLFERSESSLERIILAPLQDSQEVSEDQAKTPEPEAETTPQGLLRLNFVFKTPPTKEQVKKFAEALRKVWYKDQMPLNRIVWGGLCSWGGSHPSASSSTGVVKAAKALKDLLKRKHTAEQGEIESPPNPTTQSSVNTSRLRHSPRALGSEHRRDVLNPRSQSPGSSSDLQPAADLSGHSPSRKRVRRN